MGGITLCQSLYVADCMQALEDGTCPNERGCAGCPIWEKYEAEEVSDNGFT